METINILNNQIEELRKKYDALQIEFNLPNANFQELSTREDLISDCISKLCDVKYLLELEQNNNFDYVPQYCQ